MSTLFLLRRRDMGKVGYDESVAAVVRATSEHQARRIYASAESRKRYLEVTSDAKVNWRVFSETDTAEDWLDEAKTSCAAIESEGKAEIILNAFNAG